MKMSIFVTDSFNDILMPSIISIYKTELNVFSKIIRCSILSKSLNKSYLLSEQEVQDFWRYRVCLIHRKEVYQWYFVS